MRRGLLLFFVTAALTAACGRGAKPPSPTAPGPGPSTPPPPPLNLTGTWTGSIVDNGTVWNDVTLRLNQTQQTVSGTINWVGATTAAGTFTGTVSGNALTFRINIPVGGFTAPPSNRFCLAALSGLADISATAIAGDYTGTNTCSGLVPFPGALSVSK